MPDTNKKANPRTLENCIVALGASAGGLEALQSFFAALPMDTGIPYVVIQHLSPDYKSMLSEILSKSTDMPVMQAENGMELRPNRVYVSAPGQTMTLTANRRLRLAPQDKSRLNHPIDVFFRSLAEITERGAVAVILSGTGADGSSGIKDIRERGGVIFVQDPDSCKFDGMPRNALSTGLVDAALSCELLASEVAEITDLLKGKLKPIEHEAVVEGATLERIYDALKKIKNVNFRQYRQETVLRRIERRMVLMHKETLAEYADLLASSQDESKALYNDMLIGVTRFFRDTECFEVLRKDAVRSILQKHDDEQIRIWVAGCSTGEEAYSIAILMKEEMEQLKIKRDVKIFATDLDTDALTFAANGVYGENILDSVSVSRLGRFFIRREKEYQISREIRQMVVFSPHNVFSDAPFGRLDLISCRNMLIYFQPSLQNDIFAIFHMALKDKGYLFLGKSENIGLYSEAFQAVDSTSKLFYHNGDARIPGQRKFPVLQAAVTEPKTSKPSQQRVESDFSESDSQDDDYIARNTALFEEFMPACVIVNEENEIIHFLGEYDNYFRRMRGKTTFNLFDLLTDGLKATISTLLKEARDNKRKVQYKNISFHGEKTDDMITATAAPMENSLSNARTLYAIVFSTNGQRGEIEDAVSFDIDRIAAKRISDLEQENREIRVQLMQSVLEKENSNEELQAANEEMLTSNEELQSSNEELQSVNQELYTVNAEYELKLDEVSRLTDDVMNFLSSTMVGIMFIDHEQRISRFTQYISDEFSVAEQDGGRPVNCMAYNFVSDDIVAICTEVLKTLIPVEKELRTNKDKVFFTRVAPYRSSENKVLGCVLTFVDITSLKAGERDLAAAVKSLSVAREAAVEASHAKSDFLSRMSHDIRTPLNAIIGSVNLAMEENNPPETNDLLASVNVASKYLLGLINDILDLSKVESGKIELIKEPYTRMEFLLGINTVIKPLMDFKNIKFTISYDGNGECVIVDKLRFNQIFFNILSNAAKFTPEGGRVDLILEQIHDHNGKYGMRYYVRDNGIGMSDDFQKVCFESFAQERTQLNDEIKGSGLGLAIVKHLTNEMGGTISVKSKLGQGTEFILEFYLDTTERATESNYSLDTDFSVLNGSRVLLVDDNEMNLLITKKILERKGCCIETAVDGVKALNAFKSSDVGYYSLIITDVRMPIMDGLEATRQIRALERPDAATIPIIALTADAFNDDKEKTVEAGMTARLVKPVEPNLLYSTVAAQLQK